MVVDKSLEGGTVGGWNDLSSYLAGGTVPRSGYGCLAYRATTGP